MLAIVVLAGIVSAGIVSAGIVSAGMGLAGCFIKEHCLDNTDCADGQACIPTTGDCVRSQCQTAAECAPNYVCHARVCVPRHPQPLNCPDDMVDIDNVFCIDRYEASRPDANSTSAGLDVSRATSRAGVLPWQVSTNQEAQTACASAGKDLCTLIEWQGACEGPTMQLYPYGNTYDPLACNGADQSCSCGAGTTCADQQPCPFAGCFETCGASVRLRSTGELANCKTQRGVMDMAGNLWEHIKGGDPGRVRGGGFDHGSAETLHRCEAIPGVFAPKSVGFRCCTRPEK